MQSRGIHCISDQNKVALAHALAKLSIIIIIVTYAISKKQCLSLTSLQRFQLKTKIPARSESRLDRFF